MPRTEIEIMTGWKFVLKSDVPAENEYCDVDMPHDWAITAPIKKDMAQGAAQGYHDRWGIGWYKKELFLKQKKEEYLYYLDFGGVFENSTIWINGCEAGRHKYGYSPFRIDATSYVSEGINEIIVRVDNTAEPVDRWYSGCGIYRTVKWIEMESKHLSEKDVFVHTSLEGRNALLTIITGVTDRVSARLLERGIAGSKSDIAPRIVAESKSLKDGEISLRVTDIKLWSAEEPYLYELQLVRMDGDGRECDQIQLRIGLREIQFIPNRGVFVNGKNIKLRGVCLHQEAGGCGIAVKKEIWRERLQALKDMGCNSIRTAHHMHSSEFMDLCDEMGFYVYEECFDKWTGGLYGRYFETDWESDVAAMVQRDRNRPSVMIWGVGNEVENQAQDSMIHILKMLCDFVKTMDDTRPVTYAMNPHFKRESSIDVSKVADIQKFVDEADETEIEDCEERIQRICRIGAIVDIISCNYQEQWYSMIHHAMPDKLILGTEVYQYFMGHPNQIQNFNHENPVLTADQLDYCIGSMIWSGFDYLGESMGYPSKGWSGAMIRTNGLRKPSYYIYQSYWSKEPMVHFSVMDYSQQGEMVKEHWDTPPYAEHWCFPQYNRMVVPYMIASNCEEVRLYLNGKRYFIKRPDECQNKVITGFLPYQPGTIEVVGYQSGEPVCSHVLVTPGPAVKLEFENMRQAVLRRGEEVLLTVRALDCTGNPCFRESTFVRFRIIGDAKIRAVDNGNLMGNEPYDETGIHLYHGSASVLLRLGKTTERIVVCADAEGLISGEMVLNITKEDVGIC